MGDDTDRLGYGNVDADPNAEVLLATMDDTAGWSATIHLRAWEAQQLRLTDGQRLLDLGCGLGDAGLALAAALGANGELVGIDASVQMITAARSRASTVECATRFAVGDAHVLDEPDTYFDAVRCERTLQWLREPEAAIAEMARVTRDGGLVSLIDSDWTTFSIDIGDDDTVRRVSKAMNVPRRRPHDIGGRLAELVIGCGLEVVAVTSAEQTWSQWDPDASPAPDGCFSMWSLADDLVDAGSLKADGRNGFVESIHAAARQGCFSMTLTMFGVVGRVGQSRR